jgi:hypothetical protein
MIADDTSTLRGTITSLNQIFASASRTGGAVPWLHDPDILARLEAKGYLTREVKSAVVCTWEYVVQHPWGHSRGIVQASADYTPPDGHTLVETRPITVIKYRITDTGYVAWNRIANGGSL